ncbi:MAG: hypothetical protein FJW98_04015 [Actinobacteria bacterium]|nr:hypothetical protein [Actinomycetota bacterium]
MALFATTIAGAVALAIIVITVPRGVGTETTSDSTVATSVVNSSQPVTTSQKRQRNTSLATSAVRVSSKGVYVAASDELPTGHGLGDSISIATEPNEQISATLASIDTTTGLALLTTAQVAAASATSDVSLPPSDTSTRALPSSMVIIEVASGTRHDASLGVSMAGDVRVLPLDGARALAGIGIARDEQGEFLGIALRHHLATKLVPIDTIEALVTTMLGTSVSP